MFDALGYQEIIGIIAFVISLAGAIIYARSILMGKTKPHLYTWLVFSILTAIAFLAQLHDHGGPGIWTTGATAVACLINALLALKYGEKDIKRSDKIALAAALTAIIPWLLTKDPLGSVIIVSLIDMVAMYPTLRKSWHKPYEENLTSYNVANVKTALSLIALTNLILTTTLYPLAIIFVNSTLIFLCLWRRRIIPAQ